MNLGVGTLIPLALSLWMFSIIRRASREGIWRLPGRRRAFYIFNAVAVLMLIRFFWVLFE